MNKKRSFPWNGDKRYNTYSAYQRKKYGERVQKVTVDAGLTCPNRDGTLGTGGCIYCNNRSFNPGYNNPSKSIPQQIDEGVEFLKRRYNGVKKFIVYFQPFSNTYAELGKLKEYYEQALTHPEVIGLTIGTRPDCIDSKKLDYLQGLARDYEITIEYGLESISDATLKRINRGHNVKTFEEAVSNTAGRGMQITAHIIFGFPWEPSKQWIETATYLSNQKLDFIKVHQLHIVRDTALAQMYKADPFSMMTYDEYIEVLISFLEKLRADLIVQRLFGEAPPEVLIAPHWGKRNSELLQLLDKRLIEKDSWQGRLYNKTT
jgi:radical SAM protein (TIGR01212 family)